MAYAIMWEGKVNFSMNSVKLTGVPAKYNQRESSWRLLLQGALELIEVAQMYEGRLLGSEPPRRAGEFVYFEVIFKNEADCDSFLRAMKNKSSQ